MPEVWLEYEQDRDGNMGWALYEKGRRKTVYPTKQPGKKAAKRAAEKLADREGYAELMIYRQDGQIQERKTITREDTGGSRTPIDESAFGF